MRSQDSGFQALNTGILNIQSLTQIVQNRSGLSHAEEDIDLKFSDSDLSPCHTPPPGATRRLSLDPPISPEHARRSLDFQAIEHAKSERTLLTQRLSMSHDKRTHIVGRILGYLDNFLDGCQQYVRTNELSLWLVDGYKNGVIHFVGYDSGKVEAILASAHSLRNILHRK